MGRERSGKLERVSTEPGSSRTSGEQPWFLEQAVESGRYLAEWSQWSEWSRAYIHGECRWRHLEGLEQARMAQSLGLRKDSQVGVISLH